MLLNEFCISWNALTAKLAMVSRRRACALAVENAQRKAAEVSQLLGQALGPPLLVIEEETREWRSDQEEDVGGNHPVAHLPHLPSMPTVTAFSRVSVSFGLRDDSRRNLWLHLSRAEEVFYEVHCLKVFSFDSFLNQSVLPVGAGGLTRLSLTPQSELQCCTVHRNPVVLQV